MKRTTEQFRARQKALAKEQLQQKQKRQKRDIKNKVYKMNAMLAEIDRRLAERAKVQCEDSQPSQSDLPQLQHSQGSTPSLPLQEHSQID